MVAVIELCVLWLKCEDKEMRIYKFDQVHFIGVFSTLCLC